MLVADGLFILVSLIALNWMGHIVKHSALMNRPPQLKPNTANISCTILSSVWFIVPIGNDAVPISQWIVDLYPRGAIFTLLVTVALFSGVFEVEHPIWKWTSLVVGLLNLVLLYVFVLPNL